MQMRALAPTRNSFWLCYGILQVKPCFYHPHELARYKNIKIRIYKSIILPVVLYGCETWSLTLSEEHRLRVFEKRVLRRIFLPKG
jgi:hypothetical protein